MSFDYLKIKNLEKLKRSEYKLRPKIISLYLSFSIMLQDLAPYISYILVAGFHRASPSTALDKTYLIYDMKYIRFYFVCQ